MICDVSNRWVMFPIPFYHCAASVCCWTAGVCPPSNAYALNTSTMTPTTISYTQLLNFPCSIGWLSPVVWVWARVRTMGKGSRTGFFSFLTVYQKATWFGFMVRVCALCAFFFIVYLVPPTRNSVDVLRPFFELCCHARRCEAYTLAHMCYASNPKQQQHSSAVWYMVL